MVFRSSLPRRGLLAVVAGLMIVLAGCGAGPAPGAATEPAGASVLAFDGPTVDGATFDAGPLAGTPVVAWFWTPF